MKKDMTFSADFARCGYTKVSRQAMQIAFTPGDKCERFLWIRSSPGSLLIYHHTGNNGRS